MKLKKLDYLFGVLLIFNDMIFLALAFFSAYRIRFTSSAEVFAPYEMFYLYYSIGCIFLIILILIFRKLYDYKNLYKGMGEAQGIIIGVLAGIFILIIFNYYLQKEFFQLSRVWLFYTSLLSLAFLVVSRFIFRRLLLWFYKKAGIVVNTLIVGINEEGYRISHTFSKKGHENINIIGFIDKLSNINDADKLERYKDINVVGSIENFKEILNKFSIDRIVISSSDIKYFDILILLDQVKNRNIEIQMSPSLFEFSVSRMKIFEYMGIPLIQIQAITIRGVDKFFKYLIDYSIGIVLFLIFIAVYPAIGLLIKTDSKGPVLYSQERYGKDFKKIRIYKFRTMRTGADSEEDILEKLYDKSRGGDFKIKDDPRITKVGNFLRKTSIDELPQIINVLKGELSVIGPRALAIPEGDKLEEWEKKRMEINQGITGLWQVSGRSDVNYEERMKLDLYYIQNWSITLELRIVALTVLRMFFNKGAY